MDTEKVLGLAANDDATGSSTTVNMDTKGCDVTTSTLNIGPVSWANTTVKCMPPPPINPCTPPKAPGAPQDETETKPS